jgi:hypothetical protein
LQIVGEKSNRTLNTKNVQKEKDNLVRKNLKTMVQMPLKKILCLIQVNFLPRNSTGFPEKYTNFDCRLSFRRK